jgi:hypothetical protein
MPDKRPGGGGWAAMELIETLFNIVMIWEFNVGGILQNIFMKILYDIDR